MIGVYVTVPIACFRKGLAREFLETEILPPPATCYGFLLSLVGEADRRRHVACRIAPAVIRRELRVSTVLRTVWRLKHRDRDPGASGNMRPDFQQLLTGLELVIWLDSNEEISSGPALEERVRHALAFPSSITRYGGLSLGESTHLIDEVSVINDSFRLERDEPSCQMFLTSQRGPLTLPVWVDHVGSAGTRYATGEIEVVPAFTSPAASRMSQIDRASQSE